MMERYSEYKDSGVKWLGEIPSHWEVLKSKFLWRETFENSQSSKEDLLSVSQYTGVTKSMADSRSESLEGYKIVHKDELVINIMLAWLGGLGVSDFEGVVSPAYCTYKLIRNENPKFLHYLYKTPMYLAEFARHSTGVVPSRWRMYTDDFGQVLSLLPPLSEQDAIVRYLDSATSEIDKAIAMQQKMIDLLNERKQIIIQNAVTKGLDENVEMKESGVEFVNEIPHNWSTRRLKFSAWIRARLGWKGLKASEYVENGYPFLSAFNIENDHMKWNNLNFINKYRYDESPEIKLKIGDLLLVKDGAGIGKCARIDELPYGESTANGSLAVITSYDMLDYRYLYYFMVSKSFKDHTELLINGMGVPHFTQGEMKKIVMPVPPQAEQQQIVTYLDSEMQKFDTAITNCQRQITLLQERKQIIINEVVTGKVRVS